MAFLTNLKEVPQNSGSGGGKYMKLQQGSNLFRILGSFEDGTNIQGMLGWAEDEEGNRKPYRWKVDQEAPRKFKENPRQFYALLVWNYKPDQKANTSGAIQIFEMTQAKLRQDLLTLAKDEDWGDPRKYDLKIVRNGEGLETSYAMTPSPHKKRSQEISDAVKSTKVDMSALYRGEDPFAESDSGTEESQEEPF